MSRQETKQTANDAAASRDRQDGNGAKPQASDATATDGAGQSAGSVGEAVELDQLRTDLEAARDGMLRARADLDNYQKRVARERAEERRYASLPLVRDVLGVRDNLQRALQAAESGSNQAGLLEGVKLVVQQLTTVLEQHGCREMPTAAGTSFDPNLHEAVTTVPSEQHPQGTVTAVVRPGFAMHERVVRPAQVVVSSGPAGQETGVRSQESGRQ